MKETGFTSQTALAKAAGIQQSAISKILKGATEASRSTGKLAAAMGISADWLINGNGSIYGDSGQPLPKVDASKTVKIYDANGFTGEVIAWPQETTETSRAYVIRHDTGIALAPAGAIIIVDTDLPPATNNLVAAKSGADVTVYRFSKIGAKTFLSVDSDRLPVVEVDNSIEILGVIAQLFITTVRR